MGGGGEGRNAEGAPLLPCCPWAMAKKLKYIYGCLFTEIEVWSLTLSSHALVSFTISLHLVSIFMYTQWFKSLVCEIFENHKFNAENYALEQQENPCKWYLEQQENSCYVI